MPLQPVARPRPERPPMRAPRWAVKARAEALLLRSMRPAAAPSTPSALGRATSSPFAPLGLPLVLKLRLGAKGPALDERSQPSRGPPAGGAARVGTSETASLVGLIAEARLRARPAGPLSAGALPVKVAVTPFTLAEWQPTKSFSPQMRRPPAGRRFALAPALRPRQRSLAAT